MDFPGVVDVAELRRQRVQLDAAPEGEEELEVRTECGALAELPEKAAGGRQGGLHQRLKRVRNFYTSRPPVVTFVLGGSGERAWRV